MLSQGCMNEVLCNYIPSFPTRYRSTVQSLKWVCFMTSYWVRLVRHTFTVLQGTCVPITIRAGKKIKVWFSSSTVRSSFLAPARQLSILGAVMTWPMRPRPSSQGPLEWFVTPASKQAISLNLRQPTTHGKPPQNRKFLGKYDRTQLPSKSSHHYLCSRQVKRPKSSWMGLCVNPNYLPLSGLSLGWVTWLWILSFRYLYFSYWYYLKHYPFMIVTFV